MTYTAPKELALDPEFREELSDLYSKYGCLLTWVGTNEYWVLNPLIIQVTEVTEQPYELPGKEGKDA